MACAHRNLLNLISPVTQLPLEELTCKDSILLKNSTALKTIATLKTINGKPAAEYWEELATSMAPKAEPAIAE